jgi:benzoyl-CoA reductase/2-hydroxyglutaryl-CoA dehydratase subunit BcrC/BadD/HgdB
MTKLLRLAVFLSLLTGCATFDPYPRLQTAIRAHHIAEAESLLKAHPKQISTSDALIIAATAGDIHAAARFLAQGASLNARNAEGETALTLAARQGQAEMVEYLVQHGANPEFRDGAGRSAYDYAATWSPWELFVADNKKLIAQYLRTATTQASMAELAHSLAQRRTQIWGAARTPGKPAYMVDLQAPVIQ